MTITVRPGAPIYLTELIRVAEEEASCELYGLLKRADEKYVTEHAYNNPRFVEDLVRGVAARLAARSALRRIRGRSREFRVDPQSFRVRADRARTLKPSSVASAPLLVPADPRFVRPTGR